MTPIARFVIVLAMATLPLLASAEGKCDDDPVEYGPNKQLVVAWAIPYPQGALVRITDELVFDQVDKQLGPEKYPSDFPAKYRNPKPVNHFNDTELLTGADLKKWEDRFNTIQMPQTTVDAFDDYVRQRNIIRAALVEHPKVNPSGYSLCSCVLQRGVIVYYPGNKQEDLYVRSYFSSTKMDGERKGPFEVFAPRGGWWFSFTRDRIWFPLRLNRLLKEDAWMVLDILTPKGKPLAKIKDAVNAKWSYREAKRATAPVKLFGQEFEAVRVMGKFEKGNAATDLEITAP